MHAADILRMADRAYRAHCSRHGGGYQLPNWATSGISGRYAVLRNCNGVLARYKIRKHNGQYHLRWVDQEGLFSAE